MFFIYKQDIEMSENDTKQLPFDFSFKRQLFGGIETSANFNVWQNCDKSGFQQGNDKGVKNSQHCEMGQNCGKNISKPLKTHQNCINHHLSLQKTNWF